MRSSRVIWILVGFCIASFIYSIIPSCRKSPADAEGNGVVRKVYVGNGQRQDNVSISIPELTLSDLPSLVVYAQSDSTGEYSPDYPDYSEISEAKITFRNPIYGYKVVVIK